MIAYVFKLVWWSLHLNDVLNSTISISLKKREEVRISSTLDNLMDDDSKVPLNYLCLLNIKKEMCGVLKYFPFTTCFH